VAPNDLAAVVTTSGNRKATQDFTNNRGLLLQAVDQFVGRKVVSPGLAGLSMDGTPEANSPEAAAPQRIFNARSMLETIEKLASFAGTVRNRRKALVLVGEGIDYDLGSADSTPRELRDRLRDFIGAANRANLSLYAFDPRVFTQGGDDFVDIASGLPEDPEAPVTVKSAKLQDDLMASQDNLRTMATETGGFAVTGSPKAVAGAFDRVRVENSNYYILGYYPANEARDGKFRKIEVRVKRPGLRVQARRGYTAPKGNAPALLRVDAKEGTSPEVRDALAATLPVAGFTLYASAVPFKGTAPNASVVVIVQVDGKDLRFAPKDDRFEDSVEVSVVAIDKIGKTRGGERMTLDMPLTAKTHAFVAEAGLAFQMRLNLPAGQYQLRIAGRDAGSGRVGSVHYDLDVPDFTSPPLAMSGLVLTADQAGQVPNPRPDEELTKLLPGTPITLREFARGDVLTAFVEVYDNQGDQPHKVQIASSVQAEDGRVMFKQEDQRSSTELKGARGGYGHLAKIPLRELGPGLYVLRLEARSSLKPETTASREVQFRVR
jgi:VWFA-related protein